MPRAGMQRVASDPPAFESQLGRGSQLQGAEKIALCLQGGGGEHPALTALTTFSLGRQLPTPEHPHRWEVGPRLKELVLPEPWERTDLEKWSLLDVMPGGRAGKQLPATDPNASPPPTPHRGELPERPLTGVWVCRARCETALPPPGGGAS